MASGCVGNEGLLAACVAGWKPTLAIAFLSICAAVKVSAATALSPADAYARLVQTGELSSVTVTGLFDFSNVVPSESPGASDRVYRIHAVEFSGPVQLVDLHPPFSVRMDGVTFKGAVQLRQCTLPSFSIVNSVWEDTLLMENCAVGGAARFDGNRFLGDVKIHLTRFMRRPSFRDSVFRQRAEFLDCDFAVQEPPGRATSFSNAVFGGAAIFNQSAFHSQAKFQSTVFENDASFVKTHMGGGAVFRNVHFKGDAEFRFCRIARADFGNVDNLTLFARRADFRGCSIEEAVFNYAEFRGVVSFVGTRFGQGGASFRYANLGDELANFDGVVSAGPLDFENAHLSALRFHWREMRGAILNANPNTKVLSALHGRLAALGQSEGALDASYYLSLQRFRETRRESIPSPSRHPLQFLDGLGRQAVAYGEYLVWGWPTGYGTRLGRILLLSVAAWLAAGLPLCVTKRVLARIPPDQMADVSRKEKEDGVVRRVYEPLDPGKLIGKPKYAGSFAERVGLAFKFLFRVLFKLGSDGITFVPPQETGSHIRLFWKGYFKALWYFGSYLMVVAGLTLANTSPIVNRLIGELFP